MVLLPSNKFVLCRFFFHISSLFRLSAFIFGLYLTFLSENQTTTMKPRYSTPAFDKIPSIEHTNSGSKKHFHSHSYVGNNENLGKEHNFDQFLEMRKSEVYLYIVQWSRGARVPGHLVSFCRVFDVHFRVWANWQQPLPSLCVQFLSLHRSLLLGTTTTCSIQIPFKGS